MIDRQSGSSGFTLIEVMITLAILTGLIALTVGSIRQSVVQKTAVQENIDQYSSVRDALQVIKRDINLAYHYRDIENEIYAQIERTRAEAAGAPAGPGGGNARGAPPVQAPATAEEQMRLQNRQDPTTHFVGTTESLNFVTSNHTQVLANQMTADFAEVGYSLRDCTSRGSKLQSQCLWRRYSTAVDDDVEQGGSEVALLENVIEFSLQYIGEGKQDWVGDWRSTEGGDAVTKDSFPEAVELTLVVQEGEKGRRIPMQAVIPIHFPNNKEKDNGNQTQTFGR